MEQGREDQGGLYIEHEAATQKGPKVDGVGVEATSMWETTHIQIFKRRYPTTR